jgi:type III secretory pathway component EscV
MNNPLVLGQFLRLAWKYKKPFFLGVVPAVLIVWLVLPAVVVSFIFAIALFGSMLLIIVGFFVNFWRGWSKRS